QVGSAITLAKVNPETRLISSVKQFLVTAGQGWANTFTFGRRAPVRCCRNHPTICAEADGEGALAKAFPHELADVKLAARMHLCGPGIAQMRVMRPDSN